MDTQSPIELLTLALARWISEWPRDGRYINTLHVSMDDLLGGSGTSGAEGTDLDQDPAHPGLFPESAPDAWYKTAASRTRNGNARPPASLAGDARPGGSEERLDVPLVPDPRTGSGRGHDGGAEGTDGSAGYRLERTEEERTWTA